MPPVCSRFADFVKMKDFACAFECMSDDPVAFQNGFRNGSAATKISFHPAKLKAAEGVSRRPYQRRGRNGPVRAVLAERRDTEFRTGR